MKKNPALKQIISILLILTLVIQVTTVQATNYKPNETTNQTLAITSKLQNDEDVLSIIMDEELIILIDKFHQGEVTKREINATIAYIETVARQLNKYNDFLKIQAALMMRLHFSYLGEVQEISILTGGLNRYKPIKIVTDRGTYVWKFLADDIDKARYFVSFNQYLVSAGLPFASFYEPRIIEVGGNYYNLMEFIEEGEIVRGQNQEAIHFRNKGRLAARMQNALSEFEPDGVVIEKDYLEAQSIEEKQANWRRSISERGLGIEDIEEDEYFAFIEEQWAIFEERYESLKENFLPGYVHCDLNPGNLFFNEDGEVTGVIDITETHRYHKICEFIRIMVGGLYPSLGEIYPNDFLKQALIGFQETADVPLNEAELRGVIELVRFELIKFQQYNPRMRQVMFERVKQFVNDFSTEEQIREFISEPLQIGIAKKQFEEHFPHLGEIQEISILTGGTQRKKPIKIVTDQGTYVWKFLWPVSRKRGVRYFVALNNHLYDRGIPMAQFFRKAREEEIEEDSYIVDVENDCYVLMEYIEDGEFLEPDQITSLHHEKLGQMAAQIQNAVADFTSDWHKRWTPRNRILSNFGDIADREQELQERDDETAIFLRQVQERYGNMFKEQYEFFMTEYSRLQAHFRDSHVHNDLHLGNVKFDEYGNIVGIIDIGMAQEDAAIVEFNNLVMGQVPGSYMAFDKQKFIDILIAYQTALNEPLNEEEIRGVIEILRSRLLEEYFYYIHERSWGKLHTLERRKNCIRYLESFEQFARDFSSEVQIEAFVRDVNVGVQEAREEQERKQDFEALFESYESIEQAMNDGTMSEFIPGWDEIVRVLSEKRQGIGDLNILDHIKETIRNVDDVVDGMVRSGVIEREDADKYKKKLRICMFLHDLGKSEPEVDENGRKDGKIHELNSERMLREILPQIGYEENEVEDFAFLIKYHGTMGTLFSWDRRFGSGVSEFVDSFKDEEQVTMLTAVSCCDLVGRPWIGDPWNIGVVQNVGRLIKQIRGFKEPVGDAPEELDNLISNLSRMGEIFFRHVVPVLRVNEVDAAGIDEYRRKAYNKMYRVLGRNITTRMTNEDIFSIYDQVFGIRESGVVTLFIQLGRSVKRRRSLRDIKAEQELGAKVRFALQEKLIGVDPNDYETPEDFLARIKQVYPAYRRANISRDERISRERKLEQRRRHTDFVIEMYHTFITGNYEMLYEYLSQEERDRISLEDYSRLLEPLKQKYEGLSPRLRNILQEAVIFHDYGVMYAGRHMQHPYEGYLRIPKILRRFRNQEYIDKVAWIVLHHGDYPDAPVVILAKEILELERDDKDLLLLMSMFDIMGREYKRDGVFRRFSLLDETTIKEYLGLEQKLRGYEESGGMGFAEYRFDNLLTPSPLAKRMPEELRLALKQDVNALLPNDDEFKENFYWVWSNFIKSNMFPVFSDPYKIGYDPDIVKKQVARLVAIIGVINMKLKELGINDVLLDTDINILPMYDNAMVRRRPFLEAMLEILKDIPDDAIFDEDNFVIDGNNISFLGLEFRLLDREGLENSKMLELQLRDMITKENAIVSLIKFISGPMFERYADLLPQNLRNIAESLFGTREFRGFSIDQIESLLNAA